ncbi:YIP1 family protein [Paenibacillus thermotolerans]|uniref:YIP1 family protein n=1 Tax=Paenibacillus thermotolerans TaxID=3027807 RepID=UPI00236778EE|nr:MULTISPECIES: YIP1 family protein [unclassified Paenibacillus]
MLQRKGMIRFMAGMIDDGKYLFYVLFHPFDGFYDIKFLRKKNYAIPAIIMLVCGITGIMSYQYTGYILNYNPLFAMNSITIFLTTLFPYLLFLISNWSITTLFDGNGSMGDIFIVLSYALVPKLLFDIAGIVLSNVIIQEEAGLLYAFMAIGTVWFIFLLFCGLCVIHEYTVVTNVVTLLVSFCSAIIIVFLSMLYFTLLGKVIGFVYALFSELTKRW